MIKDAEYWIAKWEKSKNFIVEKDRIKPKSYLFSSFPKTNLYGYQDGNLRTTLVGDFFSRYQRMAGYNVLFPLGYDSLCLSSFLENKKHSNRLNDDISLIFQKQLYKLGVGIDHQKEIDLKHDQYLCSLQYAFIELFERGYIQYDYMTVYQDKKGKKIVDDHYQAKSLIPNHLQAFYLDISKVQQKIIQKIKELNVSLEVKTSLLNILQPKKSLTIPFYVSNNTKLEITLKEPQHMGGITFICLHPNYVDFPLYTRYEEYEAIERYLSAENAEEFGVFSGTYASNPLTGKKIPIFVSDYFSQDIYVGNPSLNPKDRIFAEEEGLPIIDIIQNGVFIESDLLNGVSVDEGKDILVTSFLEAEMATENTYYQKDKILLSSLDVFGALIPFLIDSDHHLYSLKEYLPFTFSAKFRPILSEDIEVPGTPMNGSINHIFSSGMLPLIALLYDDIGAHISIFSKEAMQIFKAWNGIQHAAINENELYELVFFPLCILAIIEEENKVELPPFLHRLSLIHPTYDSEYELLSRSKNNLLEIDRILNQYNGDAIRLYFLNEMLDKDFIYTEEELTSTANLLLDIDHYFHNSFSENNNALDYQLFELWKTCNQSLQDYDIYAYVSSVISYYKTTLRTQKITFHQALLFLKLLYPIIPFTAEDVYASVFKGKYLLSDDGWNVE